MHLSWPAWFLGVLRGVPVLLLLSLLRTSAFAAELISAHPGAGEATDATAPLISADGRFVFFLSNGRSLTTNVSVGTVNLFRRDRVTGEIALASVAINGAAADGACYGLAASSNGQIVVFTSVATNLSLLPTNGVENIYLRDFAAGKTLLVSANTNGQAANYSSLNAQLTPDGNYVAFQSLATDLVDGDTNGICDVFLRDFRRNTTIWISTNTIARDALSYSIDPSISADGQRIAFVSTAKVAADIEPGGWVVLRDFPGGTNKVLKATGPIAPPSSRISFANDVALSVDGKVVAFEASNKVMLEGETNGIRGVFYSSWDEDTTERVSLLSEFNITAPGSTLPTNIASRPVLSKDGRLIVFHSGLGPARKSGGDFGSVPGALYQWDTETRSNRCVSLSFDGDSPANGTSFRPQICGENRYVFFLSNATNLVPNATNGAFQLYRRDLSREKTILVSVNTQGDGNNSNVTGFSASDDGRLVTFASSDGGFVTNDFNSGSDIFLRDMEAGTTVLLSGPLGQARPSGDIDARPTSLSADGRYLVFQSLRQENGEARRSDVYLRDLWARTNKLLSANTNGSPSNGSSQGGVISADGQYVAFLSTATDIAEQVTNAVQQVYFQNLRTGELNLVTRATNGYASSGWARNIGLSGNGLFLSYESAARDIVPQADDRNNVFLWNRTNFSEYWVNSLPPGNGTYRDISDSRISPDGRSIAFISPGLPSEGSTTVQGLLLRGLAPGDPVVLTTNLSAAASPLSKNCFSTDSRWLVFSDSSDIFVYDLVNGTTNRFPNGRNAAISADGRYIVAERVLRDEITFTPTNIAIVLWDRVTGTESLVSENVDKTGNGNRRSKNPLVNADGHYVVFQSEASDLVPNDTNGVADVFLRDTKLGITLLLSIRRSGETSGNLLSANPIMSGDGRTVAFESFATDLTERGAFGTRRVFVMRLGSADSDGDGMDDDWEIAFFDDLSRSGLEDADQDGMTDLEEFRAGTNPLSTASVLRAITIEAQDGEITIFWAAALGHKYRVQFKPAIEGNKWRDLSGVVIATSTSMSVHDREAALAPRRFYRMLLWEGPE